LKKRLDHRVVTLVALGLAVGALAVGCSTRPEISEELPLAGNHSPGDLIMVTSDTTSDGFHYLEPEISPNGQRVAFTADWLAIYKGDLPDPVPLIRSLVVKPVEAQLQPTEELGETGAALVWLGTYFFDAGDSPIQESPGNIRQKGSPTWLDDENLVCWMDTPRGARLFRLPVPAGYGAESQIFPEVLFYEPDDGKIIGWRYWMHRSPAISPDGRWIAFSRFGYEMVDSLSSYTQQSICVVPVPGAGERADYMIQLTDGAAICDAPAWSPDGSRITFHATPDIVGDGSPYFSVELFTVDFDTTGFAQDGAVELNKNILQLTDSPPEAGNPIAIRNMNPTYAPDGSRIVFVSDRRAPTITLHERNIWSIPPDASLPASILFFSRNDDVDPSFVPGRSDALVLSSAMGFPTEMLDRLELEALERIAQENPQLDPIVVADRAASERTQLEFFARVMSHLYVFSNW